MFISGITEYVLRTASAAFYYNPKDNLLQRHIGAFDYLVQLFYFIFTLLTNFLPFLVLLVSFRFYHSRVTNIQFVTNSVLLSSILNYVLIIAIPWYFFNNIVIAAAVYALVIVLTADTVKRNQHAVETQFSKQHSQIDEKIDEIIAKQLSPANQRVKVESLLTLKKCIESLQKNKKAKSTFVIAWLFLQNKINDSKISIKILDQESAQALRIISV